MFPGSPRVLAEAADTGFSHGEAEAPAHQSVAGKRVFNTQDRVRSPSGLLHSARDNGIRVLSTPLGKHQLVHGCLSLAAREAERLS